MSESELENELRGVRPAQPSPELERRIARELEHAQKPFTAADAAARAALVEGSRRGFFEFLPSLGWALTGAAAALITIYFLPRPKPQTLPASPKFAQAAVAETFFEPAETMTELVDAEAEDLQWNPGEEPARLVRVTYLERYTWNDANTGAVMEFEVPREDIYRMPVALQ